MVRWRGFECDENCRTSSGHKCGKGRVWRQERFFFNAVFQQFALFMEIIFCDLLFFSFLCIKKYHILMIRIKHILMVLLCSVLVVGVSTEAQAQTKKKKKKATTSQTAKKKKSAASAAPAAPKEVVLPYNSNDCLFAITLEPDHMYGPTSAPDGGGRIQEIVADKAHPNLFEREHNSVWYKVKIPYNGELEISIVQNNQWDDYDFLVYKNTGTYFSNQVIQNKVLPVAVNLGAVDSNALAAEVLRAAERKPKSNATTQSGQTKKSNKADATPAFVEPQAPKAHIGMSMTATDKMLTKNQMGGFIKSIPVRMGEEYYIVLDNRSYNGQGHSIMVSVHADAYEPLVLFYDKKGKRYVDVDLMILEKGETGAERPLVRDEHYRGGKVKFVPGFNYTLYAKRDGYFSVYREFNARDLMMRDTLMLYQMERTERGSTFSIKDIYFEDGEASLIEGADSVLMNYVAMFRNHPDITFLVKGYVQSYGVNVEADMLLSLERAKTVKEYFVRNGISADRISTTGMTKNEIKRAAAAVLDQNGTFSGVKVDLIITGKTTDQ